MRHRQQHRPSSAARRQGGQGHMGPGLHARLAGMLFVCSTIFDGTGDQDVCVRGEIRCTDTSALWVPGGPTVGNHQPGSRHAQRVSWLRHRAARGTQLCTTRRRVTRRNTAALYGYEVVETRVCACVGSVRK